MRQLGAGLGAGVKSDNLPVGPAGPAANLPREVSPAVANVLATWLNDIVIPPRAGLNNSFTRGSRLLELQTFTFSQIFSGGYLGFSASLQNQPAFSGSISVSRTVLYPGTNYIGIFSGISGVTPPGSFTWPSSGGGPFTVTSNSITVSGQPGGTFAGTMQLSGTMAGFPATTFTLSGPVIIDPSGTLTFTASGSLTATFGGSVPLTITGTVTGGTMIQSNSGFMAGSQTARQLGQMGNGTGPSLRGIRPLAHTKL